MKLNSIVVATKSNKRIFLIIFVVFTQLQIVAQVSNWDENSTSTSIIMGDMIKLDSLLLNRTTIKVNHADYYWLRNTSKVENEQKSTLNILKFNLNIKSISKKTNNLLIEINKMTSNRKLMEDSSLRNILWDILGNIENMMDNLEKLGEQRIAPEI